MQFKPIMESKRENKGYKEKMVYENLVLSVLLYNSETWTLKEASKRNLKVFEMSYLRRIKGVTRRERNRNVVIRQEVMGVRVDVIKRIQERDSATLDMWCA